jgi:S-adenosylmethionine synthetase
MKKYKSKNVNIWASNGFEMDNQLIEIIERKGIGHPDTICDILAERISQQYSKYCIDHFGVILRHMVDKIAILGGKSNVTFGGGEMIEPIRILLNCRFTKNVGDKNIPYLSISKKVIYDFFKEIMPELDSKKWIKIVNNIHFSQGPGVVYESDGKTKNEREYFFAAPEKDYLRHHGNNARSNDTSTAVAYSPLSKLEQSVLFIEKKLNSQEFKQKHKYVGTDIKVMATRSNSEIFITVCVPFISKYTPDLEFYLSKKRELSKIIKNDVKKFFGTTTKLGVFINTRDNVSNSDLYLTLIGSAVESGDEGVVGRGNRYNGLITFARKMSMEACCGKNPVYHVGKIYAACAKLISEKIYESMTIENTVYMTSQMGRPLSDPLSINIELAVSDISDNQHNEINFIIKEYLNNFNSITNRIIDGDIVLY